jgi:hypothetical protein
LRDNKAENVALLRQEAASLPVERQAKIVAADNGATTVRKAPAKNHPAPDKDLEAEIEERKGMVNGRRAGTLSGAAASPKAGTRHG